MNDESPAQPPAEPADQPAAKPGDQPRAARTEPPAQPADQPAAKHADQPAADQADQPAVGHADQPAPESANQPAAESANQPAAEAAAQSADQPAAEHTEQTRAARTGPAEQPWAASSQPTAAWAAQPGSADQAWAAQPGSADRPWAAQAEPEQPWAARIGLIRPRHGKYIAGVCAAIGRATNTDALLWRVVIGVLSIFGVGIVIYLAAWLLIPAEGDTASPIEAVFGRGQSSTTTGLTLALAIVAVILLGAVTDSFVVSAIAAIGLVVAALAANPRQRRTVPAPMEQPVSTPVTEPIPTPSGYQPPFAPHGPYAAEPPPIPPKKPVKPKREPSRLGRLIFGVTLMTLGLFGIADLAGVSVEGSAYFAAALAVIGAGLIIGAWFGRARLFILIGIVLSVIIPIAVDEAGSRDRSSPSARPGPVTWAPTTTDDVSGTFDHRFGEATLDLTNVDFSGKETHLRAEIAFGNMEILLPPNVDVIIESDVNLGGITLFSQDYNVVGTVRNDGTDGPGGGLLYLSLDVSFGHAEVRR